MIVPAFVCALVCASTPTFSGPVLLVNYQAAGIDGPEASAAVAAWQEALEQAGARVLVDERLQRASALCGEEASCLAALGDRASATWVLAFGLGRVGDQLVSSAVMVRSRTAIVLARQTGALTQEPSQELDRRLPDWRQEAKAGVRKFLELLSHEPDPPVSLALVPAAPPPNPLRPYAWAAAGTAAAALVGSLVAGSLAWSNYDQLKSLPLEERGPLSRRQLTLNRTADGLLIAGALIGGTAATLFLWRQPRSSVAVTVVGPGLLAQGRW